MIIVGNRVTGRNPFRWDQYDSFPPALRRAMYLAPTELGSLRAWRKLRLGYDLAAIIQEERDVAERARQRALRTFWPPGHPQVTS